MSEGHFIILEARVSRNSHTLRIMSCNVCSDKSNLSATSLKEALWCPAYQRNANIVLSGVIIKKC